GAAAAPQSTEFKQAAAGLIETGVRFLESLAAVVQNAPTDETFANLVSLDPRTNRSVLSIPLPKSVDLTRLLRALSAVLGAVRWPPTGSPKRTRRSFGRRVPPTPAR